MIFVKISRGEREREVYLGDIMQAQVYSEVTTELAQKFTILISFWDHLL